MNNDWVWNDELVREFAEYYRKKQGVDYSTWGKCILDSFKQSKQQSKNNQDGEILKLKNTSKYTSYKVDEIVDYFEDYNADNFKIHSVKVLSSGEIFSVGDYCINERYIKGSGYPNKPIKRFFIHDNNNLYIQFDEGNGKDDGCLPINAIAHSPKPIFTTEQREEIISIIKNFIQ